MRICLRCIAAAHSALLLLSARLALASDINAHGGHGEDPPAAPDLHGDLHGAHDMSAAAHGAEASAGLPQFDPSSFPSQVFWLAVMFAILYMFFSRKTLPEISRIIEKRAEHITRDLNTAEELRKEAQEIQQAYEDKLNEAKVRASKHYDDAERLIHEKMKKEYDAFNKRAAQKLKETEKHIEKAKAEIMDQMDYLAAEIARAAAEKIIGVSTDIGQAKTVVRSLNEEAKAA